jgi:hypothetical protein
MNKVTGTLLSKEFCGHMTSSHGHMFVLEETAQHFPKWL